MTNFSNDNLQNLIYRYCVFTVYLHVFYSIFKMWCVLPGADDIMH